MLPKISLNQLKGVGAKRAEQFHALGVDDIDALLHYYPRDYQDWSRPVPLFGAEFQEKPVCIEAEVISPVSRFRHGAGPHHINPDARKMVYEMAYDDGLECIRGWGWRDAFTPRRSKPSPPSLTSVIRNGLGAADMSGPERKTVAPGRRPNQLQPPNIHVNQPKP